MNDVRQLVREYLDQAKLMQLATVADGKPWACSVWFAADDDLRVYWFSRGSRRHSREVETNPNVAGAVVMPQAPAGLPRGLSFEGTTEKLTVSEDIAAAKKVYVGRIFPEEHVDALLNDDPDPHFFFRINISSFVLFDAVNFPDAPRQELRLTN